jgi:hypothetical protein
MHSSNHRRRWSTRLIVFFFRRSKHRVIHHIKVAVFDHAKHIGTLDKVEAALDLVLRHDPRALQVLQTQTDGIFVFMTHGGAYAEWSRDGKLVLLKPEYVSAPETSSLQLASALVHEATHVWLEKLGFQYSPERRPRIEAICFKRQLRFVKHAGGGSELVSELERQLKREPQYFSDEAFRERSLTELQTELDRLGVPRRIVITFEQWLKLWWWLTRRLKTDAERNAVGARRTSGRAH